ncbi:MAG: hypothetical protein E7473_04420 [Ruminococcaceae bacterium]|nr:hypothetical protein [Oscillospiraceae bacterium]
MATILAKFKKRQSDINEQIAASSLPLDELLVMQELNYRIGILETFQSFCKTAPATTDAKVLVQHYRLVDVCVRYLLTDHKFGLSTDEKGKTKRETAHKVLEEIILTNQRQFSSFVAETQDQYKRRLSEYINAILPMWLQYRDTYITITL